MKTSLIALAAAATLSTSALAGGGNLLSNGDFETPGPGFLPFADWVNFTPNIFADDADEVPGFDGAREVKMFGAFLGAGQQADEVLQQVVPVAAGEQYTFSARGYHSSADPLMFGNIGIIVLDFKDAGGTVLESAVDEVLLPETATDEWILGEVTAIAPAGTVEAQCSIIHVQFDGGPAATGASFWDAASLTSGGTVCTNPADFDGNGTLNFLDLGLFLTAFNEGCP